MVDWTNMTFGEKIKHARECMGISQNKLAKLSGMAQSSISYIESGDKSPSLDTIKILAKALDLTPSFLMEGKELETAFPPHINELVKAANRLSNEKLELLTAVAKAML